MPISTTYKLPFPRSKTSGHSTRVVSPFGFAFDGVVRNESCIDTRSYVKIQDIFSKCYPQLLTLIVVELWNPLESLATDSSAPPLMATTRGGAMSKSTAVSPSPLRYGADDPETGNPHGTGPTRQTMRNVCSSYSLCALWSGNKGVGI